MKRIELAAGALRYRDLGRGRPVVFIHGLLVDGRVWGEVPDRVAESCRCIVPDLPLGSHHEAMSADADLSSRGIAALIAELLERLDLRDVVLVGNDSGGALCQMVAAWHPERVGSLVLTTCDAFEHFPPPEFAYLRVAARVPGVMAILSACMRAVPRLRRLRIAYGALTRRAMPDALLASWVEPSAHREIRRDAAKFLRSITPADTQAAAEALRDFTKPVLLAWSADDALFPISLAHRLCETIPHARLEPIEDAAVFVGLDQPERVAALIAGQARARAVPAAG